MTLKHIFSSIAIMVLLVTAPVYGQSKAQLRHQKAHQEQLAHQQKLDKTAINNLLLHDLEAKEKMEFSKETSSMIDDMLAEAKRYIGRPYVHGAKGPKAFDCSGYTSYIYKQFGYNLSPASRQQYTIGKSVSRNDLRKGDLVFFTSRSSGKNVGHVGIVYSVEPDGNFKFIHASIRGVKISDFDGYYVPRYIGAKRIIE